MQKHSPSSQEYASDHFDGEKFFNPKGPNNNKSFLEVLKWRFSAKRGFWPENIKIVKDKPPRFLESEQWRISYVGHATLLIQTLSTNILIDPIWSLRASPVSFTGPKRVVAPGIDFENLPPIDWVIISHNHYDHMDKETIQRLQEVHKPTFITPLGNGRILKSFDQQIKVIEKDWEQSLELKSGLKVILQQAIHWSARGLFDRQEALWAAFVFETPKGKIYYAGDTGFGNDAEHIQRTAKKFAPFELSFLPIGAYEPRWFMQEQHINPAEAVKIAKLLQSRYVLGIHLQTFSGLTDEAYNDPVKDLKIALKNSPYNEESFQVFQAGQHWVL